MCWKLALLVKATLIRTLRRVLKKNRGLLLRWASGRVDRVRERILVSNGNEKGFGDETSFKKGRLVTPQNRIIKFVSKIP
ncbi:hypothetical protein HanRHA438_Chr08g0360271 [Helianthus annuus]|nr:hypothetical protein HanRHA438_Chr08g0360271 [Helianthus annuus]